MNELPESKVYELGLKYWPYEKSVKKVLELIVKMVPKNGTLIDFMCGPGFLLNEISKKRPDIKLYGQDIDERYVNFSKENYPDINFEKSNILKYESSQKFDAVICTGSLHHIRYEYQENAFKKMASAMKPSGFLLLSDCYIDDYSNEKERKLAAAKLGFEYLNETIEKGAPDSIIEFTAEILENDVMMDEFKTSIVKRTEIFEKYFQNIETIKTWPDFESGYGDYVTVCRNRLL